MKQTTLSDWKRFFEENDSVAIGWLNRYLSGGVKKYLYNAAGSMHYNVPQIAEDCSQMALIWISRNIGRLEIAERAFLSYAYKIAINNAKNYSRAGYNTGFYLSSLKTQQMVDAEFVDDFGCWMEERLDMDYIQSLVERLSDIQRAYIIDYYYECLSISEIAEKYGSNNNAVSRMIHLAKHNIKRMAEEI